MAVLFTDSQHFCREGIGPFESSVEWSINTVGGHQGWGGVLCDEESGLGGYSMLVLE